MTVQFIDDYIEALRKRAAERRREGLAQPADQYELTARELEASYHAWQNEALDMRTAAAESGYSVDNIKVLVKSEKVPNVGQPGAPRVRRADLPRKPGHGVQPSVRLSRRTGGRAAAEAGDGPDLTEIAFGAGRRAGGRR